MNAFDFGSYIAQKTAGFPGVTPKRVPASYTPGPGYKSSPLSPNAPSSMINAANNSARVGGGILSAAAGGVGTVGTGLLAGANHAWNAVTPKSMNTSQGFTQDVNHVFNKTKDFAHAGAKDVYGGLGGDTNYATQHSWNQMEQGFNDPAVSPAVRNTAWASAHAGHGLWNAAQIVSNPSKILTNAPRAALNPRTWAATGSRLIPGARGGVQSTGGAARALPQSAAGVGTIANHADNGAALFDMGNAGNTFYSNMRSAMTPPSPPTPNIDYWSAANNHDTIQRYLGAMPGNNPI